MRSKGLKEESGNENEEQMVNSSSILKKKLKGIEIY